MPDGDHTPRYLVDPKSSQAVLRVLSQALGIEVDPQVLDEHAAERGEVVAKLQEMQEMQEMQESMNSGDEDPRYIE